MAVALGDAYAILDLDYDVGDNTVDDADALLFEDDWYGTPPETPPEEGVSGTIAVTLPAWTVAAVGAVIGPVVGDIAVTLPAWRVHAFGQGAGESAGPPTPSAKIGCPSLGFGL